MIASPPQRTQVAPRLARRTSRIRRRRGRRAIAGTLGFWLALALLAPEVDAQQIPAAAEPGRQRRQLEKPVLPERLPPIVIEEDLPGAPDGSDDVRFVLREIQYDGVELYPREEVAELGAELIGREVSLAELYELAARITRLYRSDGYILSKAIVPVQEIEAGRVQIKIIEGFISRVQVECDDFRLVKLLEAHAREIEWTKPTTADVLERHLLLIRDLPGVTARAILRPSPDVLGASELILQVDTAPVTAFAQGNNRGTKISGPYRADLGATLNSVLGLHEAFGARVITTFNDELLLLQGTYRQVLNRVGTSVNAAFTYADTASGGTLDVLGLQGESITWTISADQPILRSRRQNLRMNLAFDWLDSKSDLADFPNTDDKIRSFRLTGSYDWVDGLRGVNVLTATLSQGVDAFGADDGQPSRLEGELDYTAIEARFARLQNLYQSFNLLFQAQGQYAFDPVLASEEFGYGGPDIGRGFDESEMAGDHGVSGLAELQYGLPIGWRYLESTQIYAAFDYGIVFQKDKADREGTQVGKSEHAGSVSGGFRFNFVPALSAEIQIAAPIGRDAGVGVNDPSRNPRFFFFVTARY